MGMDLYSLGWRRSTPPEVIKAAEADPFNPGPSLHYNWTGWSYVTDLFQSWGVPMDEFAGDNSGEKLSRATCQAVAEAFDAHWNELSEFDQGWLKPHVDKWRWTKHYEQC